VTIPQDAIEDIGSAPGTATITATAKDGSGKKVAVKVTVGQDYANCSLNSGIVITDDLV